MADILIGFDAMRRRIDWLDVVDARVLAGVAGSFSMRVDTSVVAYAASEPFAMVSVSRSASSSLSSVSRVDFMRT